MSSPIPIILCGKSPEIAKGVKAALLPEYEAIHVILASDAGVAEIPSVLRGQAPPSNEENVGSRNYSAPPKAVVCGAGYDDEQLAQMRSAVEKEGKVQVPWLRPDSSVPTPPLGSEYGKHMVGRVKACLGKLKEEREMEGDKVVYY